MQGEDLIGLYLHIYIHSHKILDATHGREEKIVFCDLKDSSFTNNFPPCVVLLALLGVFLLSVRRVNFSSAPTENVFPDETGHLSTIWGAANSLDTNPVYTNVTRTLRAWSLHTQRLNFSVLRLTHWAQLLNLWHEKNICKSQSFISELQRQPWVPFFSSFFLVEGGKGGEF